MYGYTNGTENYDEVLITMHGSETTQRWRFGSNVDQVVIEKELKTNSAMKAHNGIDIVVGDLDIVDCKLERASANVLRTPDTFDALAYKVNGTAGLDKVNTESIYDIQYDLGGSPLQYKKVRRTYTKGILTAEDIDTSWTNVPTEQPS